MLVGYTRVSTSRERYVGKQCRIETPARPVRNHSQSRLMF